MKICKVKIEIILLIVSIFLQGTAIFNFDSFGIALSVGVIIFLGIKYKLIFTKRVGKRFLLFNLIWIITIFISYFVNNQKFDIMKILRAEMLVVSVYLLYRYIKVINNEGNINFIIKSIIKLSWIITIYGVYQFLAYYLKLPLFLNVILNNSSYNINKGLYDYYGGWSDNRIYTSFAEPSFYGEFLVILFFFIVMISKKRENRLLKIMILINLFMTYSRSGIGEFVYIILSIIAWMILRNIVILKKILYIVVGLIPIINIYAIKFVNDYIFNDLSSKSRTESLLYYLDILKSDKNILIWGNGLGSIQNADLSFTSYYVEKFVHNGYIEFIIENGLIMFLIVLIITISILKNITNQTNKFIVFCIIVNINDFGTGYNIESILLLIVLVISILTFKDRVNSLDRNSMSANAY